MLVLGASQGFLCVAGPHVVAPKSRQLCVGLLLVHGSLLLG